MFKILSICKGGGYRYARTDPPHPRANAKGLYPLHRVLMENKLGRLLEPFELVHHRDENKANDGEDNLELMERPGHSRHHQLLKAPKYVELECRCGRGFTLRPNHYRHRVAQSKTGEVYCSRSCGGRFGRVAA